MIIIDTNVMSEMMREEPDPHVLAWTQTAGRLHTTVITLAEIDYGIARLPDGLRKDRLSATAADVFADFNDMILPLDPPAARCYADIVVRRQRAGTPITMADAQIAAICAAQEATLATRNTEDFEATGITCFNPWTR